jgi:tRNA pseudouridine55 synthase
VSSPPLEMARRGAATPAGLVLYDKPAGPSSFGIVRQLREQTGARAGHAGTLDPFATGLLLVLLGSFTKEAQRFVGLEKRYETDVDLSKTTGTGDPEGEVVDEHEPPSLLDLEAQLDALRGEVDLKIPAASAVKIGGERAYKLHRRGVAIEMPTRRTTVYELDLEEYEEPVARLSMRLSSGGYVRAIAEALGGHCVTLRRTHVGPFDVADAHPERILEPAEALAPLA